MKLSNEASSGRAPVALRNDHRGSDMGDAAKPATPKLTDLLRFVATLPHSEWYLERGTLLLNRSDVAPFVEQASIIEADQTLGQALARIHACDADLFMMIFGTETVEEYVEMLEPEDVDERWHPARGPSTLSRRSRT